MNIEDIYYHALNHKTFTRFYAKIKKIMKADEVGIYGISNTATCNHVCNYVSKLTGIPMRDIRNKDKSRRLMEARYIVCYLLRKHHKLNYKEIGNYMNRSHVSIIYIIKQAENMLKFNKEFRECYKDIMIKDNN